MDRYSRMVALLKVLLPLVALALLSTLFLLSRKLDPIASIPFAAEAVQERVREQQVTGPFFSGSSERGDQISFTAGKIGMAQNGNDTNAESLSAQIDLASGARVNFEADAGTVNVMDDISALSGNVVITTSSGYKINSDHLTSAMTFLKVESPGEVVAVGPIGTLKGKNELGNTQERRECPIAFHKRG
jgi:lipopolysaccharide export system protein LptC